MKCENSCTCSPLYTGTVTLQLSSRVVNKCKELDVPLVGFASADRWDDPLFDPWIPEQFRPRSIYPQTNTVIVIGIPVTLPALETSPSLWYHELYKTVNTLLDTAAYRISIMLNELGHNSIALPRDGYGSIHVLKENPVAFFSHRHAAFLAGLGNFGVNNMILTPEYGPRVRFTSIFSEAGISGGTIIQTPICTRCMRCVTICPVNALQKEDYPDGLINKERCTARSEELSKRYISPCGFCIKVCPVGEDRKRFHRERPGIYDETNQEYAHYHKAWDHVRSYGGKP